ncbi:MAG: hypothetical protein J0I33_08435 [Microbacterium ginsengisoli]|jgi:hypothetical protein|uniref:hypothetical protein n=1 Tax=Microbacterium TaxID=33882 RepID=UPI0006FB8C0B|nr:MULTISPECIES: hypothetical protein [unclassified Microbacterium]MBN9198650.1 hypothetical protein [Microbacterium ginsengisoli]KQR93658.1 hypothetical protein ASG00_14135 [Microbacterium sp. Leaf351]KQS02771.1 hypothetical protein ASF93_09900 [Microbacterium sp. Leaf347]ODU76430.1 MAG: hypothetical protein ABT08_09405 [Microbacterium sp. SCN 71-21]OJU77640.1 MAG: hypothetical protein BGO15_11540 [Microbacterium sp. 71-23]
MSGEDELSPALVGAVSLERALEDAAIANQRAIELAQKLLTSEERVAALSAEVADLKRLLDPRRKLEHLIRQNHSLHVTAQRAKRILGR